MSTFQKMVQQWLELRDEREFDMMEFLRRQQVQAQRDANVVGRTWDPYA